MNKIPINPKPIIREAACIWEFTDEKTGELRKEKITVQYKGRSIAEIRAFQTELNTRKEDDLVYLSETLVRRIFRLPEILGDEAVTLEFLENQDTRNLGAMNEAISENENPKK